MHDVVVIPGDGSGPELTRAVLKCVDATGVRCNWIKKIAGKEALEKEGTPLPQHVLDAIVSVGYALKGPIITPLGGGFRSVNVALRQELDLYACVRPCRTLPSIQAPIKNVDIVIVRENTEDVYAGIEFEAGSASTHKLISFIKDHTNKTLSKDTGIAIKPISTINSERIIRYAFEYARRHKRRKVSCITKSNIMKYSDGIFMHSAEKISKEYPDILYEHVLVDALCMKLVQGFFFDVLVLPNLYGDIVSDLGAGLIGGLGVAPGANIGEKATVYEATHGAAPEFAGKDALNPTAMLLSATMMLRDLGETTAAHTIERSLHNVIAEARHLTFDLLPRDARATAASTTEMTDAIIRNYANCAE